MRKEVIVGALALMGISGLAANALWSDSEVFEGQLNKTSYGYSVQIGEGERVIASDFTGDSSFDIRDEAAQALREDGTYRQYVTFDGYTPEGWSGAYDYDPSQFDNLTGGFIGASDWQIIPVDSPESCLNDNFTGINNDQVVGKGDNVVYSEYVCIVGDLDKDRLPKYTNEGKVTTAEGVEATDTWGSPIDPGMDDEPDMSFVSNYSIDVE